jgi:hypothetical protein
MVDHSETATAEHGREHHGAHVAGKVVGRGLGGLAMLAGAVILFGPFLLAPLTLAIQSFRAVDDPAMEWALAIGVGLGVLGLQFLFAIQRNPLVRTVTVALAASSSWSGPGCSSPGRATTCRPTPSRCPGMSG